MTLLDRKIDQVTIADEIKAGITTYGLCALLRNAKEDSLWADAFAEALDAGKVGLARDIAQQPEFQRIGSGTEMCLETLVEHGNLDLLAYICNNCPGFLTPANVHSMLKTSFFSEQQEAAKYLLGDTNTPAHLDGPLIKRALFTPVGLDVDILCDADKGAFSPPQRAILTSIRSQMADFETRPERQQRTGESKRVGLVHQYGEAVVARAELLAYPDQDTNRYTPAVQTLCENLTEQRKSNPAGLQDKLSMSEMIDTAYQNQWHMKELLDFVGKEWGKPSRPFTSYKLMVHSSDALIMQGKEPPKPKLFKRWLEARRKIEGGGSMRKAEVSNQQLMNCFTYAYDLDNEHRDKLWRIKRGEYIGEEEMTSLHQQMKKTDDAANRQAIYKRLSYASGIPREEMISRSRMHYGIVQLSAEGQPIVDIKKTNKLASLLIPEQKTQSLRAEIRRDLAACLHNHVAYKTMSDLLADARAHSGDPGKNVRHIIVGGGGEFKGIHPLSGEKMNDIFCPGLTSGQHIRDGNRHTGEKEALLFIDLAKKAGVKVSADEREEAVALLTGCKSASELLKDVVYGIYDPVKKERNPNNTLHVKDMLRQYLARKDMHENMGLGVSTSTLSNMAHIKIGHETAHILAKVMELTPEETRRFALAATEQPVLDVSKLIERITDGTIDRKTGLPILISQTGESLNRLREEYNQTHEKQIPKVTPLRWKDRGFIPNESFVDFLAQKLLVPEKASKLRDIYYARTFSERTPYVERVERFQRGRDPKTAADSCADLVIGSPKHLKQLDSRER